MALFEDPHEHHWVTAARKNCLLPSSILFCLSEQNQDLRGTEGKEREKRKRKVGRGEDGVVPSWESNPRPTCWVVTVLTAAAAALEGKAALDFL